MVLVRGGGFQRSEWRDRSKHIDFLFLPGVAISLSDLGRAPLRGFMEGFRLHWNLYDLRRFGLEPQSDRST